MYCEKSLPGSLCRLVPYIGNRWCTVTANIARGAITVILGVAAPRVDRRGVTFRNKIQTAWNAPESFVTLDSPGLVELDTLVVSDVLGLRVRYQNARTGGPRTLSVFWYRTSRQCPGSSCGYGRGDRYGGPDGGYVQLAMTVAYISVGRDVTTTD